MRIKARNREQMNQVATSIADLSAACSTFGTAGVTIDWLDENEKEYAREWPASVTHQNGLEIKRGFEVVTQSRQSVQDVQETVDK